MIDDGSTDASARMIAEEIARGLPATLYRLSRNFGHQAAVSAGLENSSADFVAVLDADLQDPPELIPAMLEKAREGYDVAVAQRRRRKEGPLRALGYWVFYRLVAALSDVPVPVDSGDFCLLTRRVVAELKVLPESLRFPRVLRAWVGFPQTGLSFDRPARLAGKSKYTLSRLYRLATDGIVSASVRPLQVAQVFSVAYIAIIAILGGVLLMWPGRFLETKPVSLVAFGFLLILVGNFVQVFCMYILGAYVGRTYLEVKGRPTYIVMETVGGRRPLAQSGRNGGV